MDSPTKKVINFSPGPSKIPKPVLLKAQADLLNYNNTGASIMEISHRGGHFEKLFVEGKHLVKELLNVPDNFHILFLHGGASAQFSAVPSNLLHRLDGENNNDSPCADYLITGYWSESAAKEGSKYVKVNSIIPKQQNYFNIASEDTWNPFNEKALYVYYCDNETVHGIEFPEAIDFFSKIPKGVPVVCDISSNIMTRPINFSNMGIVFAGSQKNLGCAGATLVIVREDLLDFAAKFTPSILLYKAQVQAQSLYNTPSTFTMYVVNLVLKWIKEEGGVAAMSKMSEIKAKKVYDVIDNSHGFYNSIVDKKSRSRMNIILRIPNVAIESKFLKEADNAGLLSLNGHRLVGGIRVSLYNAITIEETEDLIDFMKSFQEHNEN